jgi:hypothetical protein
MFQSFEPSKCFGQPKPCRFPISTFKVPGRPPFAALPWDELTARMAGTIRTGWIPILLQHAATFAFGFNAAKAHNRAVFAGKQFALLSSEK